MSFPIQNYKITLGTHREQDVIFFEFPNKADLRLELKKLLKVRWSASQKKWYAVDMPQYRKLLGLSLKTIRESAPKDLYLINREKYVQMAELILMKGYSKHTMRNYMQEFYQFLSLLKNNDADDMTPQRIRSYILYCIERLKLKESTIHNRVNALGFYYQQVLGREGYMVSIPRPKKASSLPKVMSKSELRKMFELTPNIKHKLILQLVYGMGLRVSEVVHLKLSDLDSSRMMVHIRSAKGKKDRYVPLPTSILDLLREYYLQFRPVDFLFEGMTGGQYSIRSVQSIFKTAMNKAKINKPIGIHGLRHSYATHLLESGTDMTFIQKLLGHSNIKTTFIYAQIGEKSISKIQSPLDSL